MNPKNKSMWIWNALCLLYPQAECTLDSDEDPFHLFVRGILSAQCTDKRVNEVSKTLFIEYPDIEAFAQADEEEIGRKIRSCGLYKSKARGIVQSARMLKDVYGSVIPSDPKTLEQFPAVGRKIANLIAGEIYKVPAIVVDTHCSRVAYRLGLTQSTSPLKVEKDLMTWFPKEKWIALGHLMVAHGRSLCMARGPRCELCPLWEGCVYDGKKPIDS